MRRAPLRRPARQCDRRAIRPPANRTALRKELPYVAPIGTRFRAAGMTDTPRRADHARWQLSSTMFTLAAESFGQDRLPYPLEHHPASAPTFAEYQDLLERSRDSLRQIATPALFQAFTTLLQPRIRIEIHGFTGPDFSNTVRMHAGISGTIATLAREIPGQQPDSGSEVWLHQLEAKDIARAIAEHLPKCQGGRYRRLTGHRADLREPDWVRHPMRLSRAEEIRRIIGRRRSGVGEIGVFAGPALDWRPTDDVHGMHWLDYEPHDGRYLLHHHTHRSEASLARVGGIDIAHTDTDEFTLTPGTPEEIMGSLQKIIAAVENSAKQNQ